MPAGDAKTLNMTTGSNRKIRYEYKRGCRLLPLLPFNNALTPEGLIYLIWRQVSWLTDASFCLPVPFGAETVAETKKYIGLQLREQFRIHTGFPFHPPAGGHLQISYLSNSWSSYCQLNFSPNTVICQQSGFWNSVGSWNTKISYSAGSVRDNGWWKSSFVRNR